LTRGQVLLFRGADPAHGEGPSTTVDEDFNAELDDLIGTED